MKKSAFTTYARQRASRSAHRPRRLGLERLEDRAVLASILPVSAAVPLSVPPTTADGASSSASISADGRYIAFVSDATNLVANQEDTVNAGVRYKDVFLFDRVTGTSRLVSGSQGSLTKTGANESLAAAISDDGRYVAFTSRAPDLVTGQNEPANSASLDLFLFDRDSTTAANRIRLVNHTSDSLTTPANSPVLDSLPSISADGRHIAFTSFATNLVAGITDDGSSSDVFLYDRDASAPSSIKLVSRSATQTATTAGLDAQEVAISADGNSVAFQSSSTDLVANQTDTNNFSDIFLFDANADTLRLVSGSGGDEQKTANGFSFQVAPLAISAHGRYVAFRSFATDLVVGQVDNNNNADVFLFDRDAATTAERLKLISHARDSNVTAATGGSAASDIPVINVDLANDETSGVGLVVVFQSTATNLASGVTDEGTRRDLFLYDVSAAENTLITHAASSFVVPATTASPNIHSVDNTFGRTPVVSRDGQYIAYSSPATDLVTDQDDSDLIITNDVFRFDRLTGRSLLLSGAGGSATQTADAAADVNGISADGLIVVFASDSTDLIDDDTNTNRDVFVSVTQPPLTFEFRGRAIDLLSSNTLNAEDGVRDGYFAVNRPFGQGDVEITSLLLERNDGTIWSTAPTGNDRVLGVSDSLLTAIVGGVDSTISTFDGDEFALFAADASAADTLFPVGATFKLTVGFADRPTVVIHSPPIPGPQLEYNGKLRDRVGRSETALSPDDQKDGTFTLTLLPGTGRVTSLELERADGHRWDTMPNDTLRVLGTAASLDDVLLNNGNGSLPSQEALNFLNHGGSLVLFASENPPEESSFFTVGNTFHVTIGYDDGSYQEASVELTEQNVPPAQPDLVVRISDSPDTVAQFGESIHTVTVRNNGDAPATNVQVRSDRLDQLTSNGFAVSVQFAKGDSTATCDQVSNRVVCTLDTIAPGTEKSVDIAYLLNTPRPVTIGATASATETDANPADDSDSETTQVVGAVQTSLTVSSDEIEYAEGLAEELTYTVTITNPNSLPVSQLTITNELPDNVTLVSVSSTFCDVVAGVFTCQVEQLEANQSFLLRYVVRPQQVGTIENHGAVVQQGELVIGSTGSVDVTVVPPADTDGDALYDAWETNGVDVNADGTIDLDLPAMGADPEFKDIFVEVDYMDCSAGGCEAGATRNSRLDLGAIVDVINAFAAAPVANPTSPESFGINLRVLLNEAVPESRNTSFVTRRPGSADDFNDIKLGSNSVVAPGVACGTRAIDGHFGTADDRMSINCANILAARRLTFRYALAGYSFPDIPGAPGIAELPGNDILLAFETLTEEAIKATGRSQNLDFSRRRVHASLFMHELGHTLGLGHGGDQLGPGEDGIPGTNDDAAVNGKPNYLSVMNYNLQWPDIDINRPLDYSRQKLVDLNENSLDETVGINGPTGRLAIFQRGVEDEAGNTGVVTVTNPADLRFDWNLDGDYVDTSLSGDINVDGVLGTLKGFDDWQNLVYDFRQSADFADSNRVTSGDDTVTMEEFVAIAESVDFDEDGLSNAVDNCIDVDNPDQADGNQDGFGDLCDLPELLDTLQFETAAYSVSESAGSASVTVTRIGTGIGAVTVQYATEDDTATAGADYTEASGVLTFESGELSKTFNVPITNDTATEEIEKLKLKLSTPGGIVRLGTQTTAELSITAVAFPWKNPRDPLDTNNDNSVSPIDALVIINELNDPQIGGVGGVLPTPPTGGVTFYYDTSGDGFVSPLDPLLVINFLNDPLGGEGESLAAASATIDVVFSPALTANDSQTLPAGEGQIPLLAPPADQTPVSPAASRVSQASATSSPADRTLEYADLADTLFASFGEW